MAEPNSDTVETKVRFLPGLPNLAASLNGRAPVLHAVDHSSILWVATNFTVAVLRSDREYFYRKRKPEVVTGVLEMICRVCGEEFIPARKHPGYINVCLEEYCRENAREPHVTLVQSVSEVSLHMKHKAKTAGVNTGSPDWVIRSNVEGKQILDL